MMTHVLRRLREHAQKYECPEQTRRHYQKQWLQSVRRLGDKWLVLKKIDKIS